MLIPGKFYVCDIFSARNRPPVSGPFDTAEQAEADRLTLNCDGDCVVAKAVSDRKVEYVEVTQQSPPLPTYAAFWVYDASSECHVKMLLNSAQHTGEENGLTDHRGGQTEEGSSQTDEVWYLDHDEQGRLVVVHEVHCDATDCDGRIQDHREYECLIENLESGQPICHFWHSNQDATPIPGLFYPAWEKRRQGNYQRDYQAEAAGY